MIYYSLYQKGENLKDLGFTLLKLLNDLNKSKYGHVAEWLRRGLQILLFQFDSGRGLQKLSCFILLKKVCCFSFLGSSVGRAVDC